MRKGTTGIILAVGAEEAEGAENKSWALHQNVVIFPRSGTHPASAASGGPWETARRAMEEAIDPEFTAQD